MSSNFVFPLESTQIRSISTQKCSHGVKWAFRFSNYSSQIIFTTNKSSYSQICPSYIKSINLYFCLPHISPLPLQSVLGLLIIQVTFCFIQMNALSLKDTICTLQSMELDAFDLKSHSMHSHKFFHTQSSQTTFPSTQNTWNGFKQAFHYLSLTNKP